jgi:peptidoglycan hydrolase CwlO-like protein
MGNIEKSLTPVTISFLFILNLCFLLIVFFTINKDLNSNEVILKKLDRRIDNFDKQIKLILSDINVSNKELSSLNIKASVLNEELNLFNESASKNENDLSLLQLKIKGVIVDLKKVKDMTELQNRKLYVSE